jgi:fatty acid desaturase
MNKLSRRADYGTIFRMNSMNEPRIFQEPAKLPSLRELNAAIPSHFKRIDPLKSCLYLIFAVGSPLAIGLAAFVILPTPSVSLSWTSLLWLATSLLLGVSAGGMWVLAHEAGHGALLKPRWLENTIGLALHTILMVPYFAWQRTHRLHHMHTNNIDGDVAFAPHLPDSRFAILQKKLRNSLGPMLFNVLFQGIMYTCGFLIYLFSSIRGETSRLGRFIPTCTKTYPTRELRLLVSLNTLVYLAWVILVIHLSQNHFALMLFVYIIPIFVVNAWLVLYTMLHHSDEKLPWYDNASWTPSLGALTVCDRPYPLWISFLHFHIGRYHMFHHVNSTIPHYYGKAVTAILQEKFPSLTPFNPENVFKAAWRIGCHGLTVGRQTGNYYWYGPGKNEITPDQSP